MTKISQFGAFKPRCLIFGNEDILGVIFDKGLRFKQHLQYVAKKGAKFALALSGIAKATWGAQFQYLLQCSRFDKERAQLMQKVEIGGMWIKKLLGNPGFVNYTMEYVENTQRMRF